jgi:hypothetical protein
MTAITFTRTSDLTVEVLLREIRLELKQEKYSGRTHGKPATFRAGCRGHLCRYVERTRRREMRQRESLAGLPQGVRPDTRPRGEQRWDPILAGICDHICSPEEKIAPLSEMIQNLEMRDVERFVNLVEEFRKGQPLAPLRAVVSAAS